MGLRAQRAILVCVLLCAGWGAIDIFLTITDAIRGIK
jgi:hypothetical protein